MKNKTVVWIFVGLVIAIASLIRYADSQSTTTTTQAVTTTTVEHHHEETTTTTVGETVLTTVAHHEDEPHEGAPIRQIEVTLDEFTISPFEVEVGETVTFVVTNIGAIVHEFEITNAEGIEHHGHDVDHEEGLSDLEVELAPGETGWLTVTITEDMTVAVCLLPGHYEAGMVFEL